MVMCCCIMSVMLCCVVLCYVLFVVLLLFTSVLQSGEISMKHIYNVFTLLILVLCFLIKQSTEFPDIESMAQKLSAKAVEGILLDRHIAVSYNGLDKNKLVIGKLIDWSYYYGVHLHVLNNSCEAVSKCLESILGMEEFTRMMVIMA